MQFMASHFWRCRRFWHQLNLQEETKPMQANTGEFRTLFADFMASLVGWPALNGYYTFMECPETTTTTTTATLTHSNTVFVFI